MTVAKKKDEDSEKNQTRDDKQLWRDLVGFWILGLCNNFGYVVMLSAAHDIIARFDHQNHAPAPEEIKTEVLQRQCHIVSTGAILLADVVPGLAVKVIVPFLPFWVNTRVISAIFLTSMSFLLVAFANSHMIAIIGVACTSAACGIGESTILAYTSNYNKNTLSTWSSGTGGAGIIGSIAYAGLVALGLNSRDTMLIMMLIPILQCVAFWVILRKPQVIKEENSISIVDMTPDSKELEGLVERVKYMAKLMKYMAPLLFVYFFEYFINQGLFELEYFENTFLDKEAQYRWLCVDYQIGVFISRSSVNIISFRRIWVFAVLQFINVAYFMTEVIYFYSPTIWIPFAVVLWEGLLGGGAYVNTFYRMSKDIPKSRREFAIGVTVQADSLGIMIAGFLALPVHNAICRMPEYERLTFS
ncbi:battenin-like [Episyrphus balteatus]|uniref:battenin-like n=1 Tax=Episyrphus balteatus TaxID=286459 RepID=UPI0024855E56|nr:battenin-like [Episyrphus balteatus]XP_055855814.1 battenin-like [Episyrphus balteatus]